MKKNEKVINTFYDILFFALSIPSIFLDDLLSAIGMLGVLILKRLTFNNISKGTEDNKLGQSDKENDNNGVKTRTADLSGAVKFTPIEPFKQGRGISSQELGQGEETSRQELEQRLVKVLRLIYEKNKQ